MAIKRNRKYPMKKIRLASVTSRPILHQVPVWRLLAKDDRIDFKVFFASDAGVRPAVVKHFYIPIAWDVDLTSGYEHEFLDNKPKRRKSFYKYHCPEIAEKLEHGNFNNGLDKSSPYDAILLPGREYSYYRQASRAAKRLGIPVLFRAETSPPKKSRVSKTISNFHRRPFYQSVAAMLCIGKPQYDYYAGFGFPKERMFFSPYCVNNEFFRAEAEKWRPKRDETRRALGIAPDTRLILYVGKLMDKKRPMDLLQAFDRLAKRGEYGLVFVGEGIWRERLEEYIRERGLKNVHITGFKNQTELGPFYTAADCLVLPSRHGETWGLVLNEAMNFSLPLVASDQVGSASDLIIPGKNGYIYPMGEIDALADSIEKVFADDKHREEMEKFSFKHVDNYSPEAAAKGVMQALEAVAEYS
jgi:glycosyltransferase involved in cell wall biosynthesis